MTTPNHVHAIDATVPPVPAEVDPARVCGQWALAYVTGRPLAQVVLELGSGAAITLDVIVGALRRAGFAPLIVRGEELRRRGEELWFTQGAENFRAIVANLGTGDALGHVAVLHGRTLHDVAARPNAVRVEPRALAQFEVAVIVSASPRVHP